MTLRARVAIALVVAALPAGALTVWLGRQARRDAFLDAAHAAVVDRMESGGRERCEAAPARFDVGSGRGRGRGRGGQERPRGKLATVLGGGEMTAYDAAYRPADPAAPPIEPALREALDDGEVAALHPGPGERASVALRMPWDDGPCAVLVVRTRALPPPLRSDSGGRDWAVALAVLGASLLASLVALGSPLGRLRRLAAAVRGAPIARYAAPPGVGGGDEVGDLAKVLDDAARGAREQIAALSARDRTLTEYVDGTTHDLAIPLTVLAGHLTEAAARARAGEPIDAAMLDAALAETEYLTELVANLAATARLDAGPSRVEHAPVDLRAVVERVVARHRPIAAPRHVTLEHAVPDEPVIVSGDDILLERALSNLVHNAIRHRRGDGDGHVSIVLERTSDTVSLRVLDDGAIDDAALARLADETAADHRPRGRSLGLRIVRTIARAHGLTLSFTRNADGGLCAEHLFTNLPGTKVNR